MDRRAWLAGALATIATASVFADEETETPEIRAAIDHANRLGLNGFRSRRSRHFTAIGNAPDDYLRITLTDCEAVTRDFMEHYAAKGFPIELPQQRMTAVVLEDERAFAKFVNIPLELGNLEKAVPLGIYHKPMNTLIVQDFRNAPRALRDISTWARNLEVLAHEATHQLTYNVGMLEREGDVPACIAEGLGIYGELRRPDAPSPPGTINRGRLSSLAHYQRARGWTPLERLLVDESWRTTHNATSTALFYGHSWLLVHYLMSDPERTADLRKYLEAIRGRRDRDHRVEDARASLGDLGKLDAALKRYSLQLLRRI